MSLVLLNLAGGECVNDLKVLEGDEGFARVARAGGAARAPAQGAPGAGAALAQSTPASGALAFRGVSLFYRRFTTPRAKTPQQTATLDMDATLHTRPTSVWAAFCYQGYAAYQPLTLYWHEQRVVVHSEFRDGNVPAGFDLVRVLKESLQALPPGVAQVCLRTATRGL